MAILPCGLCALVVVCLAMSRPSAASRTESPDAVPWWSAGEFASIQKSAEQLRAAGDYPAMERLYRGAVETARRAGNPQAQINYSTALANTHLFLYRYGDAVDAYEQARRLANATRDWPSACVVAAGLANVYLFVGDLPLARAVIEEGLAAARRPNVPPYYEVLLELQYARLNSGTDSTIAAIYDAIEVARNQYDPQSQDSKFLTLEAEAWDLLGEEYLRRDRLDLAETAFTGAYRLRLFQRPMELRFSYWRLGSLRLAQERFEEAELLTGKAIEANTKTGASLSNGVLFHQRGTIRQARGSLDQALQDFDAAVNGGEQWRSIVPSNQSARTAADAELDRRVFRSFIVAASRRALRDGDEEWASKAFFAAERNRAYSLRPLPRLQGGVGQSPNQLEIFPNGSTLTLFQRGLRNSELVLSFYTDAGESYLWAVTRDSLHLYALPAADEIGKAVERFQTALIHRDEEASSLGSEIYGTLFGQLKPDEARKTDWILSLDGPLFDLPFAALRAHNAYLVESHSLQVSPSAGFLTNRNTAETAGGFLGVGDAIYNTADARVRRSGNAVLPADGQLNRLVASDREISRSAQAWSAKHFGDEPRFLRGEAATRIQFLDSLAARPAAIHLATHVVTDAPSEGGTPQASIAFSIGNQSRPELLRTPEVADLDVKGSLIVMTGCSSGTGEIRPGAGLLGLTRAWLLAGADTVLATGWPVEDTAGDLLPAFYRQLASHSAAEALRRGQIEMIRSGTWQADPAYWAAFRLTGGAR